MLKPWITALALLFSQQISPMFIDPHYKKFERENPKGYALLEAARLGNIEQVQMFLADKVNLNTRDPYGNTALTYAAMNSHEELCKLFIKEGANTNCSLNDKPLWKTLALMSCFNRSNLNIAELLLNPYKLPYKIPTKKACSQAIITFLYCLKQKKKQNDINLLFANHWKTLLKPHFVYIMRKISRDINEKEHGETTLMDAARRTSLETCEWLIAHGADVNIQRITPDGALTAISLARQHQRYLKERLGKDRSARNDYAVVSEICELLIANGAKEDEAN